MMAGEKTRTKDGGPRYSLHLRLDGTAEHGDRRRTGDLQSYVRLRSLREHDVRAERPDQRSLRPTQLQYQEPDHELGLQLRCGRDFVE